MLVVYRAQMCVSLTRKKTDKLFQLCPQMFSQIQLTASVILFIPVPCDISYSVLIL